MSGPDFARLVALSACWGLAFVFIRIAVPEFGPVALVEARALVAGLAMLLYAASRRIDLGIARRWKLYLFVGLFNSAAPFVLIATAQTVMSASWAVVLVATTPLQTALIAAVGLGERMTGRKLAGLAFGVSGVALLVGAQSPGAEAPPLWAILAALGAGTMYGIASVATKRHAGDASPIALGAGTQLATALLLAPLALLLPPAVMPGAGAIAAMLALALASTALAFIFYFALIASVGPVKTMTVNFLSPLFGVSAGVAFLGERLGWNLIAGGMLILAGLALVLLEAGARQREGAG